MAAHYLDFERPIADLESKIEELSKLSETAGPGAFETEIQALRDRAQELRVEAYANLDAWQKTMVARHPRAAPPARLSGQPDRRVRRAARRPQVRRRSGHRRRPGPLPGSTRRGHGSREGSRYDHAPEAQFRHGAPRGLPQGRAPDGHGRALQPAGPDLRRHRRRLSGPGRRGARPGRGHRPLDRALPDPGRPDGRHHRRRGRLRRGHRLGRRQQGADPRALDLFGDLRPKARPRSCGATAPGPRTPPPRCASPPRI
jgi:hypothetical protein